MIEASGAEYLISRKGWLQLHRSEETFKAAIDAAIKDRDQGVEHNVLTLDELKAMEPSANFDEFVGAIHWLNSDRKSTRLNSSHVSISYAVSCLKKKRN